MQWALALLSSTDYFCHLLILLCHCFTSSPSHLFLWKWFYLKSFYNLLQSYLKVVVTKAWPWAISKQAELLLGRAPWPGWYSTRPHFGRETEFDFRSSSWPEECSLRGCPHLSSVYLWHWGLLLCFLFRVLCFPSLSLPLLPVSSSPLYWDSSVIPLLGFTLGFRSLMAVFLLFATVLHLLLFLDVFHFQTNSLQITSRFV